MAIPTEKQIHALVTHIDDCLIRVVVAVIMEMRGDADRVSLESAIREAPNKRDEILSAAAHDQLPSSLLYLKWLAQDLQKMQGIIRSIDLRRLTTFRKANQPTAEIFENKIANAKELIDNEISGVYYCIKEIFSEGLRDNRHSNEVLGLMEEIRAKTKIIHRRLTLLTNPYLSFLTSRKLIFTLLVLFLLLVPTIYVYRAWTEAGTATTATVERKFQKDTSVLQNTLADPSSSILDKVINIAKQLSEITSTIPNLLLLSGLVFGVIRRLLLREKWQHPQIRALEDQLHNLSRSLRDEMKGG